MGIFGKHIFQNDDAGDAVDNLTRLGLEKFLKSLTERNKSHYEYEIIVAAAIIDSILNKTKYDYYSDDFIKLRRKNKLLPAKKYISKIIPLLKSVISPKSDLHAYMNRSSVYFHWKLQIIEIIERLSLLELDIKKPGVEILINSEDLLSKIKSPVINGEWVLGVNKRNKSTEIIFLTIDNKISLEEKFYLFTCSKLFGNKILSKVDQIDADRRHDKADKCYRVVFTNPDIDYEWSIYSSRFKREVDGPKLNVFLCHSSSDKIEIEKIHSDLNNGGINAWFSDKNLIGGQDWKLEISQALQKTNIVIVCLSKTSITKIGFVQKEIKYALDIADEYPEGQIFIIPLRLEDCNVPERLKKFHRIDLFKPEGFSQLYTTLKTIEASLYSQKRGLRNFQ